MRLPLLIVLLTLMSPCDRLWSAQTDTFVGNWRSRNGGELRFVVENGQLRMDGKMTRVVTLTSTGQKLFAASSQGQQ
jgi:hypothetical protein